MSGYKVAEAINAADAVWLFKVGIEFDFVISEQIMTGGPSGYMLASWIRVRYPKTPVIIASNAANERPQHSISRKLLRFIPKPYDLEHILRVVREMMPMVEHSVGAAPG